MTAHPMDFEQALGAWRAGNYAVGLAAIERLHHEQPQRLDIVLALAQCRLSLGLLDQARALLKSAAGAGGAIAFLDLLSSVGEVDLSISARDLGELAAREGDAYARLAARMLECLVTGIITVGEPYTDPRASALWEGFEFQFSHRSKARFRGASASVLLDGLDAAPGDGLLLEFGVYHGRSLRMIAERTARSVHGFDSFQGLPEDWSERELRGAYSTDGRMPSVPANAHLYPGWFSDTLPGFLEQNPGPVALVHIDCDLYSSTRTVLELLAPRLLAGSVLVFDDYLGYRGWKEHEFRAFAEFVQAHDWQVEYLSFALLGREAAVRLVRRTSAG